MPYSATSNQVVHCLWMSSKMDAMLIWVNSIVRAYPDSEIIVANTLAKWKKLEPNDINFSQGFSQKVVSTSCFVFNSLPGRVDFCCLLITFANSLDPDQARQVSGLIWIQTVSV